MENPEALIHRAVGLVLKKGELLDNHNPEVMRAV